MAKLTYTCEDTGQEMSFTVDPFYTIDDFLLVVVIPMLRAIGYNSKSISSSLKYVGDETDE